MKHWIYKQFFLIDGLGALFSAIMLGVVLVYFQPFIDIPISSLYILAAFPVTLAFYDFVCFYKPALQKAAYLKATAVANLSYVMLSLFILQKHAADLTKWGWLYFIGELLIVLSLGILEWRRAEIPN